MKENESKKIATNVSMKDIIAEIEKGPDYMKKVVDDFKKDCETLIRSMADLYKEHIIINNIFSNYIIFNNKYIWL